MTLTEAWQDYRDERGSAVVELLDAVAGRAPALDRRREAAGLSDPVVDVSGLTTLPVLAKDDLPALQRAHPPLGGLLADDADVVRLFASPGPIYEPQLAGPDPWRWTPALDACGIGPDDVVLNCFSYHLSPAGAMFDEACRAVGAVVVPGGVGGVDVQAQLVADLDVTAYIGLPSYLAALVEKFDALGAPAGSWAVTKALVTAEPLPDQLRARLRAHVPTVLMAYGTAEVGLIGFETTPGGGLRPADGVYVEICDPGSGEPVPPGEPGQVVVSVVEPGLPLVRFGTGDVSRWMLGEDGSLLLAGVLGRVGAAVKVRGMFVHPHQAAQVVTDLRDRGADAGRFVVERHDGRDTLRLELVASADVDRAAVVEAAIDRSREVLRVRPDVELVPELGGEGVLVDARSWV
ncbi:MAG: phenylacetate--CoA ligase family protein [Actinomycetes bacterium]